MKQLVPNPLDNRTYVAGLLGGAFVAALLVLMARNVIDHVPLYDELLHFFAARGLLQVGEPAIADGWYVRAELFTRLVALSISQFGDTLVAARIPALVGAVCLILMTAIWVTRQAGWLAGLAASLILCMAPTTVEMAVFGRFYTIHALVILTIGILAYSAVDPRVRNSYRLGLMSAILALLVLGWHLQESTAIAAGAILVGVLALMIHDQWAEARQIVWRYPVQMVSLVSGTAILGLLAVHWLGLLDRLSSAPLWASGNANRSHFYLIKFAQDMPLLWPLLPVAVVLALSAHRRLVLFCATVLLSGLIVHSIAGAKASRYVYYLLPFFGVIWGCALSGVVVYVRNLIDYTTSARGRSVYGLLALILFGAVMGASQEGQRTLKLIFGKLAPKEALSYAIESDWSLAVPVLQRFSITADQIVTSNSMKSLYYLGRYDYELNASIIDETDSRQEFGLDERTGRQVISTPESVIRVLQLPGSALIVLEEEKIGKEIGVPSAVMAVITSNCTEVNLTAGVGIRAWRCSQGGAVGN